MPPIELTKANFNSIQFFFWPQHQAGWNGRNSKTDVYFKIKILSKEGFSHFYAWLKLFEIAIRSFFYHIVVQVFGQLGRVGQQLRGLLEVGDPLSHLLVLLRLDSHVKVGHGAVVDHLELAVPNLGKHH